MCLYCGGECVVTSPSSAPIPWPRVQALDLKSRSRLLVDEELLRAIRTESVQAIIYWFGVSKGVVCDWRRTFDCKRRTPLGAKAAKAAE